MKTVIYSGRSIELLPTLHCARYVWYNKKKRKYLDKHLDDIKRLIPIVEDVIGLDGTHRFMFRSIRPVYYGLTITVLKVAYIDPVRYSLDEYMDTIVHEAIHLKQIQDKRLIFNMKTLSVQWEGKTVDDYILSERLNHDKYTELPWEKDVLENLHETKVKICSKISEKKLLP